LEECPYLVKRSGYSEIEVSEEEFVVCFLYPEFVLHSGLVLLEALLMYLHEVIESLLCFGVAS
jgi:hypothetical protein